MKRRGLSLMEGVLAAFLILLVFAGFVGVASQSLRQATRTRAEILSDNLLLNTLEMIHAHPFGSSKGWWGDGTRTAQWDVPVVIEGRQVLTQYICAVSPDGQRGNGSFFGQNRNPVNYDVVRVTLTWREPTGPSSRGEPRSRTLVTTVWRPGVGPE